MTWPVSPAALGETVNKQRIAHRGGSPKWPPAIFVNALPCSTAVACHNHFFCMSPGQRVGHGLKYIWLKQVTWHSKKLPLCCGGGDASISGRLTDRPSERTSRGMALPYGVIATMHSSSAVTALIFLTAHRKMKGRWGGGQDKQHCVVKQSKVKPALCSITKVCIYTSLFLGHCSAWANHASLCFASTTEVAATMKLQLLQLWSLLPD